MEKMNIPLYQRLYEDIKYKIRRNEYKKNTKLESIRSLAKKLDISTTTVEKAYNQLLIEGYIISIPRSGYIVLAVDLLEQSRHKPLVEPIVTPSYPNVKLTEDLFDIKNYKAILNKVINYESEKLYTECDPRGEIELREEIRKYVLSERDVKCDVNQIVIGPGIQNLLHILLNISHKKSVTYLTPEFKKAMNVFRAYKYTLKPRRTIKEISRIKADYLYISPSNIYPTGEVIKVKSRNDIIKWSKQNDAYIIEDDYNYFLRYNSYTVPSIHSYNNGGNVIYMGSFSKIFLPSLRLSFMILPVPLYNIYKENYNRFSQGVSKLEQLTLARFMKEGCFRRHTKKLYNLYKEKNEAITSSLVRQNKHKNFSIRGNDSNLHVILDFRTKYFLNTFIRNCDRYSLKYEKINGSNSVIFPYSGIETKDIKKLIKDLFYNM